MYTLFACELNLLNLYILVDLVHEQARVVRNLGLIVPFCPGHVPCCWMCRQSLIRTWDRDTNNHSNLHSLLYHLASCLSCSCTQSKPCIVPRLAEFFKSHTRASVTIARFCMFCDPSSWYVGSSGDTVNLPFVSVRANMCASTFSSSSMK